MIIILLLLIGVVDCSKILVIPAKDTGSHLASMSEYIYLLAEKGHSVHLFDTAFKEPKYLHSNLTTITAYVPKVDSSFDPWSIVGNDPRRFGGSNSKKDLDFQEMLKHHQGKFDQIMNTNWDLVVIDNQFNPHGFSIALRLNEEKGIPFILLDTCGSMSTIASTTMGLGRNPIIRSYIYPMQPSHSKDAYNPKLFIHRLYNSIIPAYEALLFNLFVQYYMPTIEKFGATFSWLNLYKKSSSMFTDALDKLKFPASETSQLISIGARCPNVVHGELSPQIKDFIEDESSKGTIYIAFGTYVNFKNAPDRIIEAFVGTMKKLHEYRIIFVNNSPNTTLPILSNVFYVQWTNQSALLNHSNTKLFITHGGLKSIKESICSETPIIVIPLFAEQLHNGHSAVSNNYGRVLGKFTLNENILYSTVKKIVEDPNWKVRMSKFKSLLLDRPISSLELAFHHTKRAIKRQKILFKTKPINWTSYFYSELIIILPILILLFK